MLGDAGEAHLHRTKRGHGLTVVVLRLCIPIALDQGLMVLLHHRIAEGDVRGLVPVIHLHEEFDRQLLQ